MFPECKGKKLFSLYIALKAMGAICNTIFNQYRWDGTPGKRTLLVPELSNSDLRIILAKEIL